jgi:hypothetical protein
LHTPKWWLVSVLGQKIDALDARLTQRFDTLDVRLFALETRVGPAGYPHGTALGAVGSGLHPCTSARVGLVHGEGRWPLETRYPGVMPVELDDGEGQPSRWTTLHALRS